jgi:hypothetical protein
MAAAAEPKASASYRAGSKLLPPHHQQPQQQHHQSQQEEEVALREVEREMEGLRTECAELEAEAAALGAQVYEGWGKACGSGFAV